MDRSYHTSSQYLEERKRIVQAQRTQQTTPRAYDHGSHQSVTPPAPSSWRGSQYASSSNGRRPSIAPDSGNSTPGSMSLRDQDRKWQDMQKENINLKVDLGLAREQAERLRDNGEELQKENDRLVQLCQEIQGELELRTQAVDEALVTASEFEDMNKALEAELERMRRRPRSPSGSSRNRRTTTSRREQSVHTPTDNKGQRHPRGTVSPEVSARMTELAQSSDGIPADQALPSFLSNPEPFNAALRQMFVRDDRLIRPIPSRATLLEHGDDEELEDPHAALRSPNFSELSETEYANSRNQLALYDDEDDAQAESPSPKGYNPSHDRLADTSRWIADTRSSPAKQQCHQPARSNRGAEDDYQSLGQVLQQPMQPNTVARQQRQPQRQNRPRNVTKEESTPPATGNPLFGTNMFPPTPDTMMSRPSNNSSSSFLAARHGQDSALQSTSNMRPHKGPQDEYLFRSQQFAQRPKISTSRDFMPQAFDEYHDPDTSPRSGPFLSRQYASDSSESPDTPKRPAYPTASLAGSTMIDADSGREATFSGSGQSPERASESRKVSLSIDPRSTAIPKAGFTQRPRPECQVQYDGAADERTVSSRSGQSASNSNPSLAYSPRSIDRRGSDQRVSPTQQRRHATNHVHEATLPTQVQPATVRPSRAAALRQRFNNFARRSSNAGEGDVTPTAGPVKTSSISQKFRQRRNSSLSQSTPVTARFDGDATKAFNQMASPNIGASNTEATLFDVSATLSPPRAESERRHGRQPSAQPMHTSPAVSGAAKTLLPSPDPTIGEFGELKSSISSAGSYPTRAVAKAPQDRPLVQTATIPVPFPSRGRKNSIGNKARDAIRRSLSRNRTEPVQPRLLTGRRG